jgi:hypothetical protein
MMLFSRTFQLIASWNIAIWRIALLIREFSDSFFVTQRSRRFRFRSKRLIVFRRSGACNLRQQPGVVIYTAQS